MRGAGYVGCQFSAVVIDRGGDDARAVGGDDGHDRQGRRITKLHVPMERLVSEAGTVNDRSIAIEHRGLAIANEFQGGITCGQYRHIRRWRDDDEFAGPSHDHRRLGGPGRRRLTRRDGSRLRRSSDGRGTAPGFLVCSAVRRCIVATRCRSDRWSAGRSCRAATTAHEKVRVHPIGSRERGIELRDVNVVVKSRAVLGCVLAAMNDRCWNDGLRYRAFARRVHRLLRRRRFAEGIFGIGTGQHYGERDR